MEVVLDSPQRDVGAAAPHLLMMVAIHYQPVPACFVPSGKMRHRLRETVQDISSVMYWYRASSQSPTVAESSDFAKGRMFEVGHLTV